MDDDDDDDNDDDDDGRRTMVGSFDVGLHGPLGARVDAPGSLRLKIVLTGREGCHVPVSVTHQQWERSPRVTAGRL